MAYGSLTADQIAQIKQSGTGANNQALQNAIAAYGPDSPAVQAIRGILPTQNAATASDIATTITAEGGMAPSVDTLAMGITPNPLTDTVLGLPGWLWLAGAGVVIFWMVAVK